jgi:hypothetical protein
MVNNANGSKNASLLDTALSGKSEEFKRKVLDLVVKTGTQADDPMFLLLLSTGRLEVLLEETPLALEQLFNGWTKKIHNSFDLVDQAILDRQKLAIATAAADLIRTAERQEARRFFGSLVPAVGVLLGVLGLGFVMGMTVPSWLQGGIEPGAPVKLTTEQAEALRWVQSKEGKLARNIVKWNDADLNTCLADQRKLNLTYQGRQIEYGICALWIVSPKERKFGK